jgi:hypothetical protein
VAGVPALYHLLAALWIAAMLLIAYRWPHYYETLLQEDRPVEWGTVWVFLVAGVVRGFEAFRTRRPFDALVALFCLFVAGEEFSWGQRLFGYGSPEYFLANNYQQELNLHNLPGAVFKPKWALIFALAGYGLLLPLAARFEFLRRILERAGATPPPAALAPWFVAAVVLLLWYPLELTGEWVEFLAGSLFVVSLGLASGTLRLVLSLALIFGVTLTKITDAVERERDVERSACARLEAQNLVNDITSSGAATEKLKRRRSVHKRVWGAMNDGYLEREHMRQFAATRCGGGDGATAGNTGGGDGDDTAARLRYAVDPWGMSYWLHAQDAGDKQRRVLVYSFGPNRRRDGTTGTPAGDDIFAIVVIDE